MYKVGISVSHRHLCQLLRFTLTPCATWGLCKTVLRSISQVVFTSWVSAEGTPRHYPPGQALPHQPFFLCVAPCLFCAAHSFWLPQPVATESPTSVILEKLCAQLGPLDRRVQSGKTLTDVCCRKLGEPTSALSLLSSDLAPVSEISSFLGFYPFLSFKKVLAFKIYLIVCGCGCVCLYICVPLRSCVHVCVCADLCGILET